MNAAENPLLDPVVWVILGLLLIGGAIGVAVLLKGSKALGRLSFVERLGLIGVLLLAGIFGILTYAFLR